MVRHKNTRLMSGIGNQQLIKLVMVMLKFVSCLKWTVKIFHGFSTGIMDLKVILDYGTSKNLWLVLVKTILYQKPILSFGILALSQIRQSLVIVNVAFIMSLISWLFQTLIIQQTKVKYSFICLEKKSMIRYGYYATIFPRRKAG